MRVAGLSLLALACALGVLLLARVRWGSSGGESLVPLRGPDARAGAHGLPAAGGVLAGEASGSTEEEGPLRTTASRLAGRCLLYLGDAGVPGVELRFFREEHRLATARSDEQGEFLVELGRQGVSRVEVDPVPGLWVVEQGLEEDRYVVRLAPSDVGPLRARLVDQLTREPVPEYVVRVRDEEEWSETVRTDAHGVFLTRVLLGRGPVTLTATGEETAEFFAGVELATHEHDPAGANPPLAIVPIAVGPTYRLLLDKPEKLPLKRLRAFLIPAFWLEEVLDDTEVSAELHPGDPPWVRFVDDLSWIGDARLVVVSANGRWRGVAVVDPAPGIHLDPVPIRLEAMAEVAGKIVDAEGEGVARANVQLQSVEASRAEVPRLASSNGLGNFGFEGVPPGTYAISVRHATRGACQEMIHVRADDETPRRLQLEPYLVAGAVSGVVRSSSGTFRGDVSLRLAFERGEDEEYVPSRYIHVSWQEEAGSFVGRFEFAAVKEGKCLLHASVWREPYDMAPSVVEVEAPMSDLEFVVEDDREAFRLSLLAVDDADGRWIREARLRITDGAGTVIHDGRPQGWMPARKWAEDEVLLWEVRAPGYLTRRGDRSAFALGAGSTFRRAVVRLRRD